MPRKIKKAARGRLFLLSHQDSNLDRQNQKLQCYHYTMRQSSVPSAEQAAGSGSALKRCKFNETLPIGKIISL